MKLEKKHWIIISVVIAVILLIVIWYFSKVFKTLKTPIKEKESSYDPSDPRQRCYRNCLNSGGKEVSPVICRSKCGYHDDPTPIGVTPSGIGIIGTPVDLPLKPKCQTCFENFALGIKSCSGMVTQHKDPSLVMFNSPCFESRARELYECSKKA
jgi:hypothetical protein